MCIRDRWFIKGTISSPVYPGSISPGEFMGDIKCLVANPDLGSTKPPTFFGNCIEIPRLTKTTFPGSIV